MRFRWTAVSTKAKAALPGSSRHCDEKGSDHSGGLSHPLRSPVVPGKKGAARAGDIAPPCMTGWASRACRILLCSCPSLRSIIGLPAKRY